MTASCSNLVRRAAVLVAVGLNSRCCHAAAFSPAAGKLQIPGANASGVPWTIVLLLTLLTLLPALLLSMTPLVRLLVIFHFLRQALGTQSAPTNQTLIGLSLVLTYFLMQPVGAAIYQQAMVPLEAQPDHGVGGHRSWLRAPAPLHAEVRARKRCGAVRGCGQAARRRVLPKICPCGWSRLPTFSPS